MCFGVRWKWHGALAGLEIVRLDRRREIGACPTSHSFARLRIWSAVVLAGLAGLGMITTEDIDGVTMRNLGIVRLTWV